MKKKKIFVNILIAGVTVLLTFLLLEFMLRAYYSAEKARLSVLNELPDDTFNIYYFGDSTMVGEPYYNSFSIPDLVGYMLDYKVQDKDIRYINMAEYGRDFKFSLDRLKQVLKKKGITRPSLCIIYSAHDEFLKYHAGYGFGNYRSNYSQTMEYITEYSYLAREIVNRGLPKLYSLEIDERNFFDHFPRGTDGNKKVIDKYKAEITESVKLLHKYNVPCIISTVAGNYADWEPNRSVFCGNDADKVKFEQLMDDGYKAQNQGMPVEAMTCYLKALILCDSFAETHYRLGKCYEATGNYEKAWQEYQKAVDSDGMPIRAQGEQNNFIKSILEDNIVFTIDAVQYLRENAEHGIIGFNLMIDGHHPNLKGYILISRLIADKIKQIFHETKQIRPLSEKEAEDEFSIDQSRMFEIYISRGRWFARIATWHYDPSERLKLAELYFSRAAAIDSFRYEPYLGLAMCSFLRKDTPHAEKYLDQARAINPEKTDKYLKEFWINKIIKRAYYQNHEK